VLIDGQAYLYACYLEAKETGDVDPDTFRRWEDDWKSQTSDLIKELYEGAAVTEEDVKGLLNAKSE
jgi:hypothetical protein